MWADSSPVRGGYVVLTHSEAIYVPIIGSWWLTIFNHRTAVLCHLCRFVHSMKPSDELIHRRFLALIMCHCWPATIPLHKANLVAYCQCSQYCVWASMPSPVAEDQSHWCWDHIPWLHNMFNELLVGCRPMWWMASSISHVMAHWMSCRLRQINFSMGTHSTFGIQQA